jgi:phage-related protein
MMLDDRAFTSYLRLKEIVSSGQTQGEISRWLADYPAARAAFRIRTNNLALTNRAQWNVTQFRHIEGDLWEIKWKTDNLQFRAMGFDYQRYFTMVLGCTHKGRVYTPRDCIKIAVKRISEVKNGSWSLIDYVLP